MIKTQQYPTTVTDKVRNRLEQLDDFEEVWYLTNGTDMYQGKPSPSSLVSIAQSTFTVKLLIMYFGGILDAELLSVYLRKTQALFLSLDYPIHFHSGTTDYVLWGNLVQNC